MRRPVTGLLVLVVVGLIAALALAQPVAPPNRDAAPGEVVASQPARPEPKGQLVAADKLSVTHHTVKTVAGELHYRATAGYLPFKDEAGKTKANFFYISYELETADVAAHASPKTDTQPSPAGTGVEPTSRPITFVFNGGPGAASVWLHLGTAGPRHIQMQDDGYPTKPPYKLVDNDRTWLTASDLVFIDPIGTGYSRPMPGETGRDYWGVDEDTRSVGEFIRLYLVKHQRWSSPKYLAGESYGTTRAALLGAYLQDSMGISLNGIVLISTALSFQLLQPSESNEIGYATYLPTYTAAAWYHKKLPPDLQQGDVAAALKQAERFVTEKYIPALTRGDTLTAAERAALADDIARFTGLSRDYVDKSNLRISPSRFEKELLRDQRKLVGRFDSRIAGDDMDATAQGQDYDPSHMLYVGPYTTMFNDYIRRELNYENDIPYEVLTGRVQPWNFGPAGNGYLYVGDNLKGAMVRHPDLRVMVCAGHFDLATPYFAADYVVSHLNLPPTLRKNLKQEYYPGGHMMYHVKEGFEKLNSDVTAFIRAGE